MSLDPIPTKGFVFHPYLWDGVNQGSNIDVDVAMLLCMISEPEIFGTEGISQLFPCTLESGNYAIYFGFDSVESFETSILDDPDKFDQWLKDEQLVSLDVGGQHGNSRRIVENIYRPGEEKSATAAIFEMLMDLDDFTPSLVLTQWVTDVNKTDISSSRIGKVAEIVPIVSDQIIGGNLGLYEAVDWLIDTLSNRFLAETKQIGVSLSLADYQMEYKGQQLPFPLKVGGRKIYIGPGFHEYTVQAAKYRPWHCDIVVVENKKGQIQILTHQGNRDPVNLTGLVKIIRVMETSRRGNWSSDISEEDLLQVEHSQIEPCWFILYDNAKKVWLLVNGSPKHPHVEPTKLKLEDIYLALLIALNPFAMFAGDNNHKKCPQTSCLGSKCPWYSFYLERCKTVRS